MCEMMLNIVEYPAKAISRKCFGEEFGNLLPPAAVPETAEQETHFGRMGCQICDFPHAMGPAVLVNGEMLHICQTQPGFTQAVGDGLRGEPRPMLDPAKALLFRSRH